VLDLDADGRGDVVFKTFHGAEIYLGSPIGLVAAYRFDRISDGIEKLGDVDGDGHDDLGNYTGVPSQLFRGAPGGLAPPIPLERIGDGTGDVNGDGYADLLVFDGIVYGSPAGPRGAPTTWSSARPYFLLYSNKAPDPQVPGEDPPDIRYNAHGSASFVTRFDPATMMSMDSPVHSFIHALFGADHSY